MVSRPQGSVGYGYYPTGRMWFVRSPAVGNLTDPNDMAGVQTQYRFRYNALGQYDYIFADKLRGEVPDPNVFVAYDYNEVGLLEKIIYPNGVEAEHAYDELNQLIDLTYRDNQQTTIAEYAYTHYPNGQRQTLTLPDGTVTSWEYDDLNRLTREIYDPPGTSNDYDHQYQYELNSNRYSFNDGTDTTYYFYNAANQLLKESTNSGGASPLREYDYDNNGSLTGKTDHANDKVLEYIYNHENRLSQLKLKEEPIGTTVDSLISEYTYDPDGILVVIDDGVREKRFLIDTQNPTGYAQVLREITEGQVSTTDPNEFTDEITYLLGLDVVGQTIAPGDPNLYLYVYDGLGSVRDLLWFSTEDVNGELAGVNYNYDAYGQPLGFDGATAPTSYLFTGERYDSLSKMQRHGQRWYNPALGLWNRYDPFEGDIREPISLHKYLYAHNNPINRIDPSGMEGLLVETETAISLGEFMEADAGVTVYPVWVKATSVIMTIAMTAGGGLVFTRDGSPNNLAYDLYLERQLILQQQQAEMQEGYQEAVKSAIETGKYTRREIRDMPVFYVFKRGPIATPEIWENDLLAMTGIGTKKGWPAPNILNYQLGINETNRPEAMSWAVESGVTSTLGVTERDEYPYASVLEGGGKPWLRVAEVARYENRLQGRELGKFYGTYSYQPFTFLVVLVP